MLVLTRKTGERIRIGDAWVTVVRITPNSVRIGIEAPPEIGIARAELLELVAEEPIQIGSGG
jgi:carbon storage regulator